MNHGCRRYYEADGVRLYSQQTWREVMGESGRAKVAQFVDQVSKGSKMYDGCPVSLVVKIYKGCPVSLVIKNIQRLPSQPSYKNIQGVIKNM